MKPANDARPAPNPISEELKTAAAEPGLVGLVLATIDEHGSIRVRFSVPSGLIECALVRNIEVFSSHRLSEALGLNKPSGIELPIGPLPPGIFRA